MHAKYERDCVTAMGSATSHNWHQGNHNFIDQRHNTILGLQATRLNTPSHFETAPYESANDRRMHLQSEAELYVPLFPQSVLLSGPDCLLSHLRLYVHGMLTALTIHDHLITFDREVELIWRRRVTVGSVIFLINRYTALAMGIVAAIKEHKASPSVSSGSYVLGSAPRGNQECPVSTIQWPTYAELCST
ncbi:hypothetical protein BC629DRAFT_1112113 [Irpex lacteus]|nr:hypothetical protein BC629DRAFT_1112113 [Irpex lacteus]